MKYNIDVNVEGSELVLKNKAGDYVIIPKKYRREVQDMIKDGCHGCIDKLVDTLPIMEDYAEDGSLLPDWDKVKSTLNPKNWGVEDYTDKGDFNTAYSSARQAGEKEFMWNNKRYSTNYKGTPQQQLKETGITDEQLQNQNIIKNKLYHNLQPRGYDQPIKRVTHAIFNSDKDYNEVPYREDAYSLYMGHPQKNNTFQVSKYSPSISKDKNTIYYSINSTIGDKNNVKFEEQLLSRLTKNNNEISLPEYNSDDFYNDIMGNYKQGLGKDEHGQYIYYYDKWDVNPFNLKNPITKKEITTDFGKPFEIYNRIYFRENPDSDKYAEYDKKISDLWDKAIKTQDERYIEEANKLYPIRNSYYNKQNKFIKQYYSDKELSEIDINKKNFDTLALQRELSNRGYKLLKSTKEDGTLDGVWGEETKKALEDWQNKNKQK